jgi:4-amino-4-deoxy-L-arabinose transferase-like glycosyltransferase
MDCRAPHVEARDDAEDANRPVGRSGLHGGATLAGRSRIPCRKAEGAASATVTLFLRDDRAAGLAVSRVRGEQLLAALLLAALAGVLVWNSFQYPWRKGYDATASAHYAEALGLHHRLPTKTETDVWHNPPLFYAVAGSVYEASKHLGVLQPGRAVQLTSALCVVGIAVLTFLLASELFPESRLIPLLALVVACLTPVLVRAGSLFHPEPLATLLSTGGLYVLVRGLARDRLGWRVGVAAGLLLGLANITRTWALAVLGAALLALALRWAWTREQQALQALAAVFLVSAAFVLPWLAVKTVTYGSPFAYSRPDPEQWRQRGRPASFWIDLAPRDVLEHPYQPWFRNRLVATVYADWWGDYWRVWRIPSRLKDAPSVLPGRYARPLTRQSLAGLGMTAVTLAGLVALAVRAIRRRDAATALLLLSVALVALAFVGFLVQYPKQDGDNIKALYVLYVVPALAIAASFSLDWLRRRGPLGIALTVGVLAALAVPTVWFVVLPA